MDLTLGPGRVLASSERIDAAAYRDLITLSGAQALQGGGVRIGRLFNIVERLLAAGPRVRIDDLRISVAEEYDTRGKLSVAYAGPPRPDLFDLELLGRSFTVELGAATTEAALRRGIAVAVSSEQPQVSRREQRLATERITGHLLQVMTGLGVRRDDEGHLTVKIALLDGQLTVNGEPSSMGALSRNLTGSREPE